MAGMTPYCWAVLTPTGSIAVSDLDPYTHVWLRVLLGCVGAPTATIPAVFPAVSFVFISVANIFSPIPTIFDSVERTTLVLGIAYILSAVSDIFPSISHILSSVAHVFSAVSAYAFSSNCLCFTGQNGQSKCQNNQGFLNEVFHVDFSFLNPMTMKIVPSLIGTKK